MNPTKLIALDPNVLLATFLGHRESRQLLDTIREYQEYIKIICDTDGVIWQEYHELASYFGKEIKEWDKGNDGSNRLQTVRRDNFIYTWLSWFLDNQSLLTRNFPTNVTQHIDALKRLGCDIPVEPQLLVLCTEPSREAWMFVSGRDYIHKLWKKRGTHEDVIVEQLKVDLQVKIFKAVRAERLLGDWVDGKRRFAVYPHTELELEDFMTEWRKSGERDLIEFKQPNNEHTNAIPELTWSILGEASEAVCAMANSYGGKVFVGITPAGEVKGFEPIYNGVRRDDDFLRQQLGQSLLRIKPNLEPSEFRSDLITLHNERKIIVIDIEKPIRNRVKRRKFDGIFYYRLGSITKSKG